jgi:hypothetical protein
MNNVSGNCRTVMFELLMRPLVPTYGIESAEELLPLAALLEPVHRGKHFLPKEDRLTD